MKTAPDNCDAEILRQIARALDQSTGVPNRKIDVKVENGWVTLGGNVHWHYQRDATREAVSRICNVKGVTNLLAVKKTAEVAANSVCPTPTAQ